MKDGGPRRFGRNDGLVSRKLSGPVIRRDPTTMTPIEPRRVNVTQSNDWKEKARTTKAVNRMSGLSFEEIKELVREGTSILACKTVDLIKAGNTDAETIANLQKVGSLAKQFLVEERHSNDGDDSTETTEQLEARAAELLNLERKPKT